jgi:2-polyprenyl-3-methyl-5-hydroxy-6-metoxy-1,4-benzoquinol methylase
MKREDWNRRYAAKEFIWSVDANRFLGAEAANLSPGKALDLAAGEGRNTVWLAEQGWTVRAIDFSEVAIEKAKRLAAERKVADKIDFQVADLRGYAPEVHHFDLVVLLYLQIPQAELTPVLVRAAQAVAPGGTFLLVAAVGGELQIEKAGPVERPVETSEGTKVAIDCLVRAKRP